MLGGANQVLAGTMMVQDNTGDWYRLGDGQAAEHIPCDYYNVKVPVDVPAVSFPRAGPTIGAVSMFYKWVPPHLDVQEDELPMLFQLDWFGEGYLKDPTDLKTSPLLRADAHIQRRFWDVIKRNEEKLGFASRHIPLNPLHV
jgi:hypothetical protein